MVGLVKIQKRCQKWILHAKISRKGGITQLSMSTCFQVTFPIWPPAAILDFGFSQIPPPFSRGSWGLNFFLNTSKSSIQVSNLTMLSVVTGPPDCTQLIRSCVENECCCPRTVSISNVNFTSKIRYTADNLYTYVRIAIAVKFYTDLFWWK